MKSSIKSLMSFAVASMALSPRKNANQGVRVTIGEAPYLLSNEAHWMKAAIKHDRKAFNELLDAARPKRSQRSASRPCESDVEGVTKRAIPC
jgi:hypothetical protein